MGEKEEWVFGTARADVVRACGRLAIELRGVVTAPAYEALHMRLAAERLPASIVMDWPALLAVTNRSAVEAALRGSPSGQQHAVLLVPPARMLWATRHCVLMSGNGISRSAMALPVAHQWAPVAA